METDPGFAKMHEKKCFDSTEGDWQFYLSVKPFPKTSRMSATRKKAFLSIFIIMLFLVKFDKSQFISIFFSAIIIETILIIAGKIKNQKNLSH